MKLEKEHIYSFSYVRHREDPHPLVFVLWPGGYIDDEEKKRRKNLNKKV